MFDNKNKTYIMGILNVTPDSFSDGGSYKDVDAAVRKALEMADEGADIIDVGGESTRPGYVRISDDEEIERVIPVIEGIREKSDITISVDTYKYNVAKAAFEAGADILNDIWGFKADERLAELTKSYDKSVCLMHNRLEIADDMGENLIINAAKELKESVDIARKAGIADRDIFLDPGIGFAKSYEQNMYLIAHIDELIKEVNNLCGYEFDFMMAASRKSVIGLTLDVGTDMREEATVGISVYAVLKGCRAVRVHDVGGNSRALRMINSLYFYK